ncbi:MAG: enoyl-CoA hydratase/isomerase family protein, partial [Acetobacteraceae bacterium]|nr:enoyl-CoA hydratase/isomerase family protein [Acetobacteraceae bacterium]
MERKLVQYGVAADGVATVRLHRPGRGNSWTNRMNQEYRWAMAMAMAEAERDEAVRVIVVTGTGRQFCVGADMKALDTYTDGRTDYVESVHSDQLAQPGYGVHPEFDHDVIWQWGIKKPIICAVNGACAGMGLALAAFSDL